MARRSDSSFNLLPGMRPGFLNTNAPAALRTPRKSTRPVACRSPWNPENSLWVEEKERRLYLQHLREWSFNHDSSPHFHGSISLYYGYGSGSEFKLGRPVKCILTDSASPDARKVVLIQLFEPRYKGGRYRLLLRSGAGWIPGRQYLDNEFFTHRKLQHAKPANGHSEEVDRYKKIKSELLGPKPEAKDTVIIRPLFRHFTRLPLEIQQMILGYSVGKLELYRPGQSTRFSSYLRSAAKLRLGEKVTKLSTIFLISKSLNEHLVPWIYRSTTFHFGTEGFTNFMWLSGPVNRAWIKKVTLAFGEHAPIHCIRWFAPDPIFDLFDPPLTLYPRAMQYFWRCQIQDLVRELHLSILSVDISGLHMQDIPFVAQILRKCFGSVETLNFTWCGTPIHRGDARLGNLDAMDTWAQLCGDIIGRNFRDTVYFSAARMEASMEDLSKEMAGNCFFSERTNIFLKF
ncbi:uncharacterized protein BDR25DRAFT_346955 [Lindgomyces ingoldianus]|uniref:Uncharacterized protein n=1 Tax=Lindgomyces ingoldianus TaxID=673940 RepID=A0ACB6QBG8_9PLEO|nr:uncharacterized protein BDR25DRAFT_346955 [Lindgomyces ingoldianus]KAF2463943.1 hypothetical protein BDR25DRAFT_346955 [Lindgomyces ingoldianus]